MNWGKDVDRIEVTGLFLSFPLTFDRDVCNSDLEEMAVPIFINSKTKGLLK